MIRRDKTVTHAFAFVCRGIGFLLFLPISSGLSESPTISSPSNDWRTSQREDVRFLSSEELRGRGVADETIHQAAEFIAARMSDVGLKTDLFSGSPMQAVEIPLGARAGSIEKNQVSFKPSGDGSKDNHGDSFSAGLGSGMNPLAIGSTEGKFSGQVAFVGYGITAPKLNYDDYANIDVRRRAVIMLRKEPGNDDVTSVFDGKRNSRHAFFETKIKNAIAHDVSAVIMVNDAISARENVESKREALTRERARKDKLQQELDSLPETAINSRESLIKQLAQVESIIGAAENELEVAENGLIEVAEANTGNQKENAIPVLSISRSLASRILKKATGKSLQAIENTIESKTQPSSYPMNGWQVDLTVQLEASVAKTSNVIGIIPGRGTLAEESVVIGAHYDHVGMGGFGSLAPGTIAVHNGADDNASGTAVLLASAQQLIERASKQSDHRRLIFIAFTGEERGLVGSKYYAKYPRFPLEKTVAMINLDMVGRLRDNELTLYGTGSGDGMSELVDRINRDHRFDIFKVPSGYGPSDHQSFYERGVPVLFFFTGLHNDYHRPTDDFDKIDFGGMARITDMVSDAAWEFATGQQVPSYAKTNNKVEIRRQLTSYLGVTLSAGPDQVIIAAVTAGAPGEKAGIQVGDRVETIGRTRVRKTSEVLEALRQHSPGDTITIQVRRRNKTLSIPVKLEARPTSQP